MMVVAVVIGLIYSISLLLIFLFSLSQLHLTWHYLRGKSDKKVPHPSNILPVVTVQLPLYNEKYVIERLLRSVASLDYPANKLEIQVLDDSDDDSIELIEKEIRKHQLKGLDIVCLRRESRDGYKAGALAYGLERAKGEFIAIFDADFIPAPDFIRQAIGQFEDPNIGMVQTRWSHLNRDYSLLTRLQAFGLDAHFTVEQSGRHNAGSFINFNGTGGIWRKSCIIDAGGWSSDTLTEDLDLSYRAQLKGWKFFYMEDHEAPAELPVIMQAIKSQQYRWNKGAAETARKHSNKIWRSKMPLRTKLHAYFHLFNSSIFVCILIAAIMSVPMLFLSDIYPIFNIFFRFGSVFLIGFFSIALFYWTASKKIFPVSTMLYYWRLFPPFLSISMGLSLHNAMAVLEGLAGKKTAFIRTPKFNILNKEDTWKGNQYIKLKLDISTLLEGLLATYFLIAVVAGILMGNWFMMIFHVMLAVGFAFVFLYSMKAIRNA